MTVTDAHEWGSQTPERTESFIARLSKVERINFLFTNRIPRRLATILMGRFSRIESRLLARAAIRIWRLFAPDLDLSDAATTEYGSLNDCFTRRLKPGARPFDRDPSIIASPSDGEIGAFGRLDGKTAIQAKGFPYGIDELLIDPDLVRRHEGGLFVTLRLRSVHYHRFHAPTDGTTDAVHYVSGDTWNVNPIALKRVERLYCKNERVVIPFKPAADDFALTLVPVAAILVAGVCLDQMNEPLDLRYRGPNHLDWKRRFTKGDEMGYFRHGSTIVAFLKGNHTFAENVREGATIRAGQPLFRRIKT